MKGLWNLPTRTIDFGGNGIVAFDGIVAGLVTTITIVAILRRSKRWPQTLMLYAGMICLSAFFILNWIDLMIRRFRKPVTYNYIIFGAFNYILRVLSDIFVLCGTHRLARRCYTLRPELPLGFMFITFLGMYQTCLLFALCFTWLSFAALPTINAIAAARSGFEVAFTTVQFTAVIALFWCWLAENWRGLAKFYAYNPAMNNHSNGLPRQGRAIEWLLYLLLLRSFCELVTVSRLDTAPHHLTTIQRARDVVYGLWSVLLVCAAPFAVPPNSDEVLDPVITQDQNTIDKVTSKFIEHLQTITANGTKTAPLLDEGFWKTFLLERGPGPSEPEMGEMYNDWTRHLQSREIMMVHNGEVRRLQSLYGKWTPIHKWSGPDGGEGREARSGAVEEMIPVTSVRLVEAP